jgi:hypothetical protein
MTDDRSLERAARSWLEEGPTRAPDRPVEAALSRIQTTRQERDLRIPWRLPTMNPMLRLAGLAVGAVLAVGIAVIALRPASTIPPGTTQTAAPSATPQGSQASRPIPNGTYAVAPLQVADILARLASNTTLTADEKTAITRDVLEIDGATTLHVEVTVTDTTFTLAYASDSRPVSADPPWPLYVLDATTIAVRPASESSGIQAYGVTRVGDGFTLRAMSPASEAVEAFVRSVLLESAAFVPVP